MKFSEAMDRLKSGAKVTREPWKKEVYFKCKGTTPYAFQPALSSYHYNEEIMLSTGWVLEGSNEELSFCDIIPYLQKGSRVRLKEWEDESKFLYLDKQTRSLVVHRIDEFVYNPEFSAFLAEDWIEV